MSDFENPIDKILRQARERGEFNDLPGKGKPIQWENDALTPEDQRMAQRLLKHNNFTLDWIEIGKALDAEFEQARTDLALARAAHAEGRLDETGWQAAKAAFLKKVDHLNQRIIGYNLRVPVDQLARRPYPKETD